jgi:dTDP-4-amino-4,6-dideoxygalactose transaminase
MKIPFNSLAPGVARLRPEIDAAIARVLDRGWFILGPEDETFEKQFAEYLGLPHAIGVANGTDAIQLALLAMGVGPGDEVICPALTAAPSALAILAAGAEPVFADIDPITLTLDTNRLDECVSDRTKVIIPVHLYGLPADMPAIMAYAQRKGLMVLEDCAQAHGSSIKGSLTGTFSEISAFSFYPTKNLGAYGDGGAVATRNDGLALRVRQLGNLGQTKRFTHDFKGFNSRLDEIHAAILQVLLTHLDDNNNLRRERADWYGELLANVPDVSIPPEPADYRHVYHLYVIRHPNRDGLKAHLASKDIGSDIQYPTPMHQHGAFKGFRTARGGLGVAEKAVTEILSLPMYPHLTYEDVVEVSEAIRSYK